MDVFNKLDFSRAIHELLPKLMGDAMKTVVIVTIVAFLLAIVIGFILALGRISKYKIISSIVVVFQEIIRGTPLMVQLVYIFYVIPLIIEIIAYFCGIPSYKCNMSATVAGIAGLAINHGTYLSEVIRSAIISIDNGQIEAALALGFSKRQAIYRIVIPQAFKNSIPVFGNYFVMMVKDTSLMAYVTVQEFLMITKSYTSQTFLTIESYTILAGVYLVICLPLSMIVKAIERKLNRIRR
ncbi:amino acid ABC transporter permease [uncultured Clostridium sp.]|uniref:amino acid ABC transporter permease n=1 Tax=uncultured Clostridium sp. TaxID=59620 RepID=UPI0025F64FEA|nr:amino acid ABC transporter permease [uncultured Clostridium sp.]